MQCRQWIFDMDGTLVDSMETVWGQAPLVLLARFGRTPRPGLRETLLPMDLPDCARYLVREYQLPLDSARFEQVMKEVTLELYQQAPLKPGVRELLERLRAEGARMCVCSNTWETHCCAALTRLGVADCFEFILTAQGEKNKDKPAVFLEAMHRLGGSDPAACVVCEDALYAARTAHDAGFVVLGMEDADSRADAPALRALSHQFVSDWRCLDWRRL